MLHEIPGLPDGAVGVTAQGTVTAHDYATVLVPALERALRTHPKIRFLYHLGADFGGFTAGALWDDAKVGIRHLTAFEKIAVVTDVAWLREAVRLFAFLMPCPVEVFGNDHLAEAKTWIRA